MGKKIVKGVAKGFFGKDLDKPKAKVVEAPAAAPAAAVVEAPKEDTANEDNADTESAKKAARSRGKRGLSVARSSGSGLNI